MSARSPRDQAVSRPGWGRAVVVALSALLAMAVVAALGLWAAGASDLPSGAFLPVLAATVVTAAGGAVRISGDAGGLAGARAGLTVMPLSVTLVGALVIGAGFLRPLRRRAVVSTAELTGWSARIAVVWLAGLLGAALTAHRTFAVPLGDDTLNDLGELFGVRPRAGFTADVPWTLVAGSAWLAGVLVSALLVSRSAPLPLRLLRLRESVRPAAHAMLVLLLVCVAVGAVVALVVAATRGRPAETLALVLLGLPNVVWPVFTVGLGATWNGRVEGPFALPMPHVLDEVLRGPDTVRLNLGALAEHDGRVWWLVVVDAVLVLAAAFLTAAHAPPRTPVRWHALRTAVALLVTVLVICLVGRISAHYGLSVLGLGDLGGGLSGRLILRPEVWSAAAAAALWGSAAGLAAGWAVGVLRRGREAERR
ncbi:streptophobe family protein [Streptomyces sp. NPDC021608]|uniref:streptophobe family protein n=1 Tax=Streptomyces sp. NPDC021608 TaxID=3154903 RepID=UPI0033EC9173